MKRIAISILKNFFLCNGFFPLSLKTAKRVKKTAEF